MCRDIPSIGTAGWSLGKQVREHFLAGSSQLERYATRLNCCEINSTFYRLHRPKTYARWLEAVPADFRFSQWSKEFAPGCRVAILYLDPKTYALL